MTTPRPRLERLRWLAAPLTVFAASRLGVLAVAYLAMPLIADSPNPPPYHLRGTDNLLLDVFGSRWDTGFYVSIAEEGYKYEGVEFPSVAFFPLLPILMALLGGLVGDPLVAGILISNLSLLGAMVLFYRLVADQLGDKVAGRAVWYLAIFPSSVFGSAVYTESLFLLTSIGSLFLARRGRWAGAGLVGVAAALTRFQGFLVAVLLAAEWWRQRRESPAGSGTPFTALLAPAATPLGTAAYMTYCWQAFGDPVAFLTAASAWGRVPRSPYATMAEVLQAPAEGWGPALLAGRIHLDNWIDLGVVLLFVVMGCVLLSLKRWGDGLYVLLGVTVSFGSGLLMSQRRYMWMLFPVFVLVGQWGWRPWVDRTVTVLSLCGLALFTALFANGYWVG